LHILVNRGESPVDEADNVRFTRAWRLVGRDNLRTDRVELAGLLGSEKFVGLVGGCGGCICSNRAQLKPVRREPCTSGCAGEVEKKLAAVRSGRNHVPDSSVSGEKPS